VFKDINVMIVIRNLCEACPWGAIKKTIR